MAIGQVVSRLIGKDTEETSRSVFEEFPYFTKFVTDIATCSGQNQSRSKSLHSVREFVELEFNPKISCRYTRHVGKH